MKCKICDEEYPSEHYFAVGEICKDCYESMSEEEKEKRGIKDIENELDQNSNYSTLNAISQFYKGLAWLVGILASIGFIILVVKSESGVNKVLLGITVAVGISAVLFAAISETIKLFIDIGKNNQQQTKLLKELVDRDKKKN